MAMGGGAMRRVAPPKPAAAARLAALPRQSHDVALPARSRPGMPPVVVAAATLPPARTRTYAGSSVMQIAMRPIDQIRPYPGNPRLNDAAVDAVIASIREFGW